MTSKVKWSLITVAAILFIALIAGYSAAPALFSQGLQKWAERQGYDRVIHGQLNVLPLKGAISVRDLKFFKQGKSVLSAATTEVKISLASLLQGELTIELVHLSGAQLQVKKEKGNKLIVGGLAVNKEGDSSAETAIKLIQIEDAEVHLNFPRLESTIKVNKLRIVNSKHITVEKIQLTDLQASISRNDTESWKVSGENETLKGKFDLGTGDNSGAQFNTLLDGLSLKINTIEITGNSVIKYQDTILDIPVDEEITIDEARITGINTRSPEQALKFVIRKSSTSGASSSWHGEAYLFNKQPEISLQGSIESTKETLMSKIAAKSLGLKITRGKATVKLKVNISQSNITGSLSLLTTDLHFLAAGKEVLGMKQGDIEVSLAELLKGELKINYARLDGTKLTIEKLINGATKIAGITLSNTEDSHQKSDRKRYPIESLSITNGQLELLAPGLELTMLVNQLNISKGKYITADIISLPDLKIDIVHSGKDDWKLVGENNGRQTEYGFGSKGYDKDKKNNLLQGLVLKINEIKLTENSHLRYKDTSSGSEIIWSLNFNQASIKDIDNSKKNSSSSITLSLISDEYEKFNLQGSTMLFSPTPKTVLKGHIEAVRLTPLTPVTNEKFGFNINSGQIDADVNLNVADSKINGRIDLNINLLSVSETNAEKLKPFEASLYEGLKLPQMVQLLTDKHGVMNIGLPVSGDSRAPSFDLDIDMEAAVSKAVSSVASVVIAPVLTSIIRDAKTRRKRLASIRFMSDSNTLNKKAIKKLDLVAKKLNDNPERLVTICGITDGYETAALALAQRRTKQIRNQLITNYGIAPKRLIACLSTTKTYEDTEEDDDGLLSETKPEQYLHIEIR